MPESVYEEFMVWQKHIKSKKTFKPTAQDKRDLAAARKNRVRGNYVTLDVLYNEPGGSQLIRKLASSWVRFLPIVGSGS